MPQRYFEYAITARPWAMRGRGAKRGIRKKPKPFTVIAQSGFDAILLFKAEYPRMTTTSRQRGMQADPPSRVTLIGGGNA